MKPIHFDLEAVAQANLTAAAVTPAEVEMLLTEAKNAAQWDGSERRTLDDRRQAMKQRYLEECE